MKKHLNTILLLFNILSFIILLITVYVPFIESNLSDSVISSVNNVIINLCCCVHISTLFYYLLVYFPEKRKSDNIRALIAPKVKTVATLMQILIAYLTQTYNIKTKGPFFLNISPDEFLNVKSLRNITVTSFSYLLGEKKIPFGWNGSTEIEYFEIDRVPIQRLINEILDSPNIIFEDEELVSILSKINECYFIKSISSYHSLGPIVTVNGFDNATVHFYKLYSMLLRYTKPDVLEIKP